MGEAIWESRGAQGGVETWRLQLPKPIGRRRFVYAYDIGGNVFQARTVTGCIMTLPSLAAAKAAAERDAAVFA